MPRPIVQELLAKDLTKGAFKSINRSLGVLKSGFAGLGAALSVGGFSAIVKSSIDAADNINKLSTRLGASTQALSQYQLVADRSGVSFKTLTTGLQRMTRRISEAAKGSGEAKDALAEIGLAAQDLNDLKPEQQFELIADAMKGVEGQSDKVRIAMRLFDTEGVSLLQTMEGGSAAIREVREQADALGTTLSQNTANSASDAKDAMSDLGAVFAGVGTQMVSALAPAVAAVARWLTEVIPKAVEFVGNAFNSLLSVIASAGSGITYVISAIQNDLASLANFAGLDKVGLAFRKAAEDTYKLSNNLEGFSVAIGKAATAQSLLNGVNSDAVNINEFLDAGLSKRLAKQKDLEKALARQQALYAQRQKAITDYVAGLQKEADTLGFTNAQLREYELRQLGAGQATIDSALALQGSIDAFEKQASAIEAAAAAQKELEAFAADLTRAVNPAQELAEQLGRIEAAFNAGAISADTYGEAIFQAFDKFDEQIAPVEEKLEKVKTLGDELGPVIADAFGDAIVEGGKFSDILKGLEKDLLRVLTRSLITRPLTDALGGFLGGFGFPSFRAVGGPVNASQPYVVGENGPELFVPRTNGEISTNTPGATINVIVQGVQDAASFARNQAQVARAAGQALRQAQAAV